MLSNIDFQIPKILFNSDIPFLLGELIFLKFGNLFSRLDFQIESRNQIGLPVFIDDKLGIDRLNNTLKILLDKLNKILRLLKKLLIEKSIEKFVTLKSFGLSDREVTIWRGHLVRIVLDLG